jgi:hypothetical protein
VADADNLCGFAALLLDMGYAVGLSFRPLLPLAFVLVVRFMVVVCTVALYVGVVRQDQ